MYKNKKKHIFTNKKNKKHLHLSFFFLSFFWTFCRIFFFKNFFLNFLSKSINLSKKNAFLESFVPHFYKITHLKYPKRKDFVKFCKKTQFSAKIIRNEAQNCFSWKITFFCLKNKEIKHKMLKKSSKKWLFLIFYDTLSKIEKF